MNEQPDAIRLAESLTSVNVSTRDIMDAADVLRRLHRENELLHERHAGDNEILKQMHASNQALLEALKLAEAGLADIGDADREPGDDLAWCERRAAEPLPTIRAAIKVAEENQ